LKLYAWYGLGDGQFEEDVQWSGISRSFWLEIGDVDNDGNNDIIFNSHDDDEFFIMNWNGTNLDYPVGYDVVDDNFGLAIADATNDGLNDVLVSSRGNINSTIRIFAWDAGSVTQSRYPGILIRETAMAANFSRCWFKFGPVMDQSHVSMFEDSFFPRTGGSQSLLSNSVINTHPIVRCYAMDNFGGGGRGSQPRFDRMFRLG
jgi:hypothetical protein